MVYLPAGRYTFLSLSEATLNFSPERFMRRLARADLHVASRRVHVVSDMSDVNFLVTRVTAKLSLLDFLQSKKFFLSFIPVRSIGWALPFHKDIASLQERQETADWPWSLNKIISIEVEERNETSFANLSLFPLSLSLCLDQQS